jgi:hypothetical protein
MEINQPQITDKKNLTMEILTKWLFVLSLILLGIVFSLQGVGVLKFPVTSTTLQQRPIKPVRVGGLLCQEPVWDFGTVDSVKNPRLSHEFTLVNESNETIKIKKIHSTCGCMVAEDFDKELTPGKSTKIKVNVQLPPMPQLFQKNLAVQTNNGVVPLDVIGEIAANSNLHSLPKKIDFGSIQPGEIKERTIQIFRYDLSRIVYDSILVNIKGMSCKCEVDENAAGRKLTIKAHLSPIAEYSYPSSYVDGEMIVKTREPYSELRIPVCVRVFSSLKSE